jgi:hypothetical protein
MGISSVNEGSRYHTAAHWICHVFGDYVGRAQQAYASLPARITAHTRSTSSASLGGVSVPADRKMTAS